ncbi:MAG: hypothetical protein M3R62_15260 [Acidobacteriota bacterium]|nr:hypothetical protein [Acidobacteriota bacterium]MDQ2980565.1 hypothetical protein [Acidobacteriota bacterium]
MAFRTAVLLTAAIAAGGVSSRLFGADRPAPAASRSDFQAQFPKSEASAAAIELERLAANLGIDLVPSGLLSAPKEDKDRPHPSAEAAAASQAMTGGMNEYLDRELKSSGDRIGSAPDVLDRYVTDHTAELTAIESLLLRESEVRWETDLKAGQDGPRPNYLGLMRLQRLLIARSLIEARREDVESAERLLEASWRLNDALASRPELISQIILLAAAKFQVGALRKIDSPAYGWSERLRGGTLYAGYLAAFQNEFWFGSRDRDVQDMDGPGGAYARTLRRFVEELQQRDICSLPPEKLREVWDRAIREEFPDEDRRAIANMAMPNLLESLARWRRYLVDAELTALVLDARAERDSARRRAWPDKLLRLGQGVCPGARWSYRAFPNGTATFAFEAKIAEDDTSALRLPLTFSTGAPASHAPKASKGKSAATKK